MTALDTLEHAQTSVDQLQHGLEIVQGHLDRADELAMRVDDIAIVASNVVAEARRLSKFALVSGVVVVVTAVVTIVVLRSRSRRQVSGGAADSES